jgi:hypothetical protein
VQSLLRRRLDEARFERLNARGHEEEPIERQRLVGVTRRQQMPNVGRVEGASEEPETHPRQGVVVRADSRTGADPQTRRTSRSPGYVLWSVAHVSATSSLYLIAR